MSEPIALVVAMARDGAIGRDNALPWRLPEDLARFKRLTLGHGVVMGRRTWESIGRNLPGRTTIVVTRDRHWSRPGTVIAGDLDAALAEASARHPGQAIMVIGGAQIFALALPLATRIHLTEIDLAVPDADTFFPRLDREPWQLSCARQGTSAAGLRYTFSRLEHAGGSSAPPPARAS